MKQTKKLILFLILMLLIHHKIFSQFTFKFHPKINSNKIELNSLIQFEDKNIKFTNIKFYISNIKLLNNDSVLYQENESYHLINLTEKINSFNLKTNLNEFNQISFDLGIDSITNENGVKGGDLDPIKGMYWAWQSGYINIKLEGEFNNEVEIKQEFAENTAFEYHLGGFLAPNNTIHTVTLDLNSVKIRKSKLINISFDLDKFFQFAIINNINKIMSPSENAVKMSKILADSFSISE